MRIVHYFAFLTLLAIVSCQSTRKAATALQQIQQQVTVHQSEVEMFQPSGVPSLDQKNSYTTQPAMLGINNGNALQENNFGVAPQPQIETETKNDFDVMAASFENKQNENIQSFAQVKQMAAAKQINLTKKQLKRLDKLDNKYHGDFNKFEKDAGNIFDTQTSKVIAAVGVVGLLLLIITGSGFGAFILILSVGALLLKWLGIISF